ncbi:hypothetical protein F2Q69_00048584 [Brassica cretica]|uniref:PWWP domain-containing protein n=1 Tax=Brassica cretica TaxID=69181 RepID=A0A8S9PRE6_BRACR|nr:hypothetical protein F2Q69_00048584 [Brassica cretica]
MNGVSSLLKLKQDVSDNSDAKDEDGEEEEHGYHVGDFVWGKIKNHPWWPGQIYDPSEASDLALKIKQKGKMLVAYFGDGTFAWCGPSQLKPFAESFKECSNVSSSRGIVTAVKEAVEEMGRHMERLLIRDCTVELDNRVVKNAGIKEGVAVRDARREMISSLLVGKPEGILQDVKGFAETVSFSGLLELEIVKRKVSAFFRSKRGYGLTEFPEAQPVPGLEDKNNELQHRRKQKSIAEILENESCAKVRFEIEPEDGKGKSSRKKVKRSDELVTTTNPRSRRMKEVASIKEDIKGKRKRKKRDEEGSGEREEDEADNDSTPLASLRKRAKVDDASSAGNGETSTQNTTKRERKKSSKYFSPEFLSDFSSKGRKKTKTEPESSEVPSQSQGEELSNAVDFLRLGATTEEIRDLIRVSALGTEYPKDSSSRDMVREFMSIYRSFAYHEGVNKEETPNESGKKEREGKTKKQEFSGAELFVTFGPGSTLPKKEALIEIYGKFGALDEERSYVLDSNLCARVAFLNVDDGEKAFESSLQNSPFASTSTVKFRLKYPNERAGEKKGEAEAAETKTVEMEHLKNKFEEMISLVDKSQGRMTEEVKVKLEEEMVNLLEEVRKMPLS